LCSNQLPSAGQAKKQQRIWTSGPQADATDSLSSNLNLLNENGGHSLVLTIVFEEHLILDRNTSITIKLNVAIMAWGWSSFDPQVKLYCPLLGAGIPVQEACLLSVMNEFIQKITSSISSYENSRRLKYRR
jgi:hypothetical protein